MKSRRRHIPVRSRWALALFIGIAASMLLGATMLVSAAAQQPTPKQTRLQQVPAQAAAAAKTRHAPKSPAGPIAKAASCPRYLAPAGIASGDNGGFHEAIANYAVIAPAAGRPFEYIIYAGARKANPQQGLLIVVRLDRDPCAATATGTRVAYFETPLQQGALTLTQLGSETVAFTTAGGGAGHFDYITGTFS